MLENDSNIIAETNWCYILTANSKNDTKKPTYLLFQRMCHYYLLWILPIIIIIGVLGSLFCLAFLIMSKLFPKTLLIWLVSICVGDLMIIILDASWMMLKMWWGFDIRDINNFICTTHKFLSNYFFYWSAYMQATISAQRAYLVLQPIKARSVLRGKLRIILLWLIISSFLIYPHLIYLIRWRVQNNDCDPVSRNDYVIVSLLDLIIWGLIPFGSMVASTLVITRHIYQYQHGFSATVYRFSHASASSSIRSYNGPNNNNTNIPISPQYTTKTTSTLRHGGINVARQVAQLLITMNIWYLLTTFPLLIFLTYLNFINPNIDEWTRKFYYFLFRSFSFFNASSNWFFYCATGKLFRKTAKQVLYRLFCFKSCYKKSMRHHDNIGLNDYHVVIGGIHSYNYMTHKSSNNHHQLSLRTQRLQSLGLKNSQFN